MTTRSRARRNRRIEAVDADRDIIALAGRDPFKHPGSTQTACLPDGNDRRIRGDCVLIALARGR